MAKRPAHSRYRRLPGHYRFGDRKPADPAAEPQLLSLYLPGTTLDQAEVQARRSGHATVQDYCEDLLRSAIEAKHDREQIQDIEARRGPMEGLKAIADDPEYLAELSANHTHPHANPRPAPPAEWELLPPEARKAGRSTAAEITLRHAAAGVDDPSAFLPTLRRGEAIAPEVAAELLQALTDLEVELRDAPGLDRPLAYALHRLAFEGQVLLTDAWPGAAADPASIDVLRVVQEAVDRVLSGEDIRYFADGPAPA